MVSAHFPINLTTVEPSIRLLRWTYFIGSSRCQPKYMVGIYHAQEEQRKLVIPLPDDALTFHQKS